VTKESIDVRNNVGMMKISKPMTV
jgi:hypothetical protein